MCQVRKERGNVPVADMTIEQDLAQGDGRNLLGQCGAPKQGAGQVVGDRCSDGTADQVHGADELDALLIPLFELEYEAKDVASVYETDYDDISRVGNLTVEDSLADARLDELYAGAF